MVQSVNHKGVTKFSGTLEAIYRYLIEHWGSVDKAYEVGVKIVTVR